MKPCPYSDERERIVAEALRPVASELRMIEAADLIALLHFEFHAELADLVSSAAELYFMPGTVNLGIGGEYKLGWTGQPQITLDLEMRPRGATIYLRLTLENENGSVEINHIAFDKAGSDPAEDTAFLRNSLMASRFMPSMPERMSA